MPSNFGPGPSSGGSTRRFQIAPPAVEWESAPDRVLPSATPGPTVTSAFLNPRVRSLPRGNLLVLGSLALALPLSHFPNLRATPWLILPALLIVIGMLDTVRCMRRQWNFYHGGVLLCLYMDLLALILVLFLMLYPAWA